MIRTRTVLAAAAVLALCAGTVTAQERTRLRLAGEGRLPDGRSLRVIIDGDLVQQTEQDRVVEGGWIAILSPVVANGDLLGSCVDAHCTLTTSGPIYPVREGAGGTAMDSTGDLLSRPATLDAVWTDSSERSHRAQLRLVPAAGPIPGHGELADPDAVEFQEMVDLLAWAGVDFTSANAGEGPPTGDQRKSLADWQRRQGRPPTGLIFQADLEGLRANMAREQAAAGWRPIGGPGWSGGYPSALLPDASTRGSEQRFASADGRAVLTVTRGPPLSDEAHTALVQKALVERGQRSDHVFDGQNLRRTYVEGGVARMTYHGFSDFGFVRLELTYPASQEATWRRYETLLPSLLRISRDYAWN